MNREDLEKIALETVSAENYYELTDFIDVMPDNELQELIECKGIYSDECKLWGGCEE
jgi:hypothetical protein